MLIPTCLPHLAVVAEALSDDRAKDAYGDALVSLHQIKYFASIFSFIIEANLLVLNLGLAFGICREWSSALSLSSQTLFPQSASPLLQSNPSPLRTSPQLV